MLMLTALTPKARFTARAVRDTLEMALSVKVSALLANAPTHISIILQGRRFSSMLNRTILFQKSAEQLPMKGSRNMSLRLCQNR